MLTSSCESESHGIFETAKCAIFVNNFISEIDTIEPPMFIFNDNKAAVTILTQRSNSGLSKHFDIKLRYVTWLVEQGLISVFHASRIGNYADVLTHSLPARLYEEHLINMYGEENIVNLVSFFLSHSRSGGELRYRSLLTEIPLRDLCL